MEKERKKDVYQVPACITVNVAVEGVICASGQVQGNPYEYGDGGGI